MTCRICRILVNNPCMNDQRCPYHTQKLERNDIKKPPPDIKAQEELLKIKCAYCDIIQPLETIRRHERVCDQKDKKPIPPKSVSPVQSKFRSTGTLDHQPSQQQVGSMKGEVSILNSQRFYDQPIMIDKDQLFPIVKPIKNQDFVHPSSFQRSIDSQHPSTKNHTDEEYSTYNSGVFNMPSQSGRPLPLYFSKKNGNLAVTPKQNESYKSVLNELRGPANVWNLYGLSNLNLELEKDKISLPQIKEKPAFASTQENVTQKQILPQSHESVSYKQQLPQTQESVRQSRNFYDNQSRTLEPVRELQNFKQVYHVSPNYKVEAVKSFGLLEGTQSKYQPRVREVLEEKRKEIEIKQVDWEFQKPLHNLIDNQYRDQQVLKFTEILDKKPQRQSVFQHAIKEHSNIEGYTSIFQKEKRESDGFRFQYVPQYYKKPEQELNERLRDIENGIKLSRLAIKSNFDKEQKSRNFIVNRYQRTQADQPILYESVIKQQRTYDTAINKSMNQPRSSIFREDNFKTLNVYRNLNQAFGFPNSSKTPTRDNSKMGRNSRFEEATPGPNYSQLRKYNNESIDEMKSTGRRGLSVGKNLIYSDNATPIRTRNQKEMHKNHTTEELIDMAKQKLSLIDHNEDIPYREEEDDELRSTTTLVQFNPLDRGSRIK